MQNYIIAKKIRMSQTFLPDGRVMPTTWLECDNIGQLKIGQEIKISGISKGKGFQGVVKRWGFRGAPKTHGTKHGLRSPGSIGTTNIARVLKGKKMAGRMGGKQATIKNLEIIEIKDQQIAVKGAVPGPRKAKIKIYEN